MLLLILPSQLAINAPWLPLIYVSSGIFSILWFIIAFLDKNYKINKPLLSIWLVLICLLFFSVISSWINNWFRPMILLGALCSFFLVSLINFSKLQKPIYFVRILVLGTAISGAFICLISILIEPPKLFRYQGFFNNPNGMGEFTSNLIIILFAATINHKKLAFNKLQTSFFVLVIITSSLLLLMSNSRTALVSVISVILLLFLIELVSNTYRNYFSRKSFRKLTRFTLVIGIVIFFLEKMNFFLPIYNKFVTKAETGDISSDRFDAWMTSLNNLTWFGHGRDYKEFIGSMAEATGHNLFITYLDRFGLVIVVIFLIYFLLIFKQSLKASLNRKSVIAPLVLACLTGFLVRSMFAGGTLVPLFWLFGLLFAAFNGELRLINHYR